VAKRFVSEVGGTLTVTDASFWRASTSARGFDCENGVPRREGEQGGGWLSRMRRWEVVMVAAVLSFGGGAG
jgi:hypothetical protein